MVCNCNVTWVVEVGDNSILLADHLGVSVTLGWWVDNTRPTDRDIQGVASVMAVTTKAWALALPKYFLYISILVSGNKTKNF